MWTFDSDTEPGYWVEVESPTNVTLRDLTSTANGPVAVGDKGVAVGRGQDRWGVILENGPGARSNTLYAVDAADDGERVWFAGAGGAFGYYDLQTGERRDHSVPRGNANAFHSLAVAGDRGEEKILLGDDSGNVLPGHIENETELDWSWETRPNSGNAVEALAHDDGGYGYAVDAGSNVFMTTADDDWTRVGIEHAQGSFYDSTFGDGVFLTGGGNGMVYEADALVDHDDDAVWTPTDLGGFAVYGLDAGHGAQIACGEGGNVYIRMAGGEWEQGKHDATHTFRAGLVDQQMVVVGASGLIVERRDAEEASEAVKERYGDGSEDDSGGGYAGYEDDEPADGGDGADAGDGEGGAGDDAASDSEPQPPIESSVEWVAHPEPSDGSGDGAGDGDRFDGRGENYDGDETTPEEDPENHGSTADSGNDEADPPDGDDSGNDEADPPDGDSSGNDEADPPDESADGGDSGNDEADPPDQE